MATRYPLGCALGLMLSGVALQALAEPPAAPASNNNGLMSFPNVSVQNAPVPASKQAPAAKGAAATAGLKAFMTEDGKPAQMTPEAAAQLSNAATVVAGKTIASTASASANVGMVRLENGGMMMEADQSLMMFEVARKDADGKVIQQCVTGEDSAKHALHSKATTAAKKESRNAR